MRKLIIGGVIAVMLWGLVIGAVTLPTSSIQRVEANAGTQWKGEYFNNLDLSGSPALTRTDDKIDFDWGTGSPDPAVGSDNFTVRWTKDVNFPSSGAWTFHVEADDALRMWIDVTQIVAKWDVGGYWTYDVKLDALTAGTHSLKVEYKEVSATAKVKVWWDGGSGTSSSSGTSCSVNWDAAYYDNNTLSGSAKITRTDGKIDFNWGGGSPDGSVPADNFSARWTKTVSFDPGGHYRFQVGADDGIRMWIDVTQIVDQWHGNDEGYRSYTVDVYALTAGNHDLKVEYYEATGNAGVQVCWEYIGGSTGGGGTGDTSSSAPAPTAVPPTVVYAAVVGDPVNVRTGPGRGNPVFTQIPFEEDYVVLAGVPDLSWVQIDLRNGATGWVSNEWVWLYATPAIMNEDSTGGGQPDFVDTIPRVDLPIAPPASPPEDDPYRKILHGYTTDTVNFRSGPNLNGSRVIGSVPQGANFVVEAHNGNGAWYLIDYQGIRGWISALHVVLTDGYVRDLVVSSEVVPEPAFGQIFVPEDEQGNPATTVRGRAQSNLKLRDEPSILTGEQISSVPLDAEFVIQVRTRSGSWYRIEWEGQTGWVNAVYVTLIEGTVPDLPIVK